MTNDEQIAILSEQADRFMVIVRAFAARKMLGREIGLPVSPARDALIRQLSDDAIDNDRVERIAADGFEACCRALVALGAPDVTIFECNPTEGPL